MNESKMTLLYIQRGNSLCGSFLHPYDVNVMTFRPVGGAMG